MDCEYTACRISELDLGEELTHPHLDDKRRPYKSNDVTKGTRLIICSLICSFYKYLLRPCYA